ncbi:protein of unknown function [Xenorhabdus poinarii G6]|uniref:Uncharacterized protein n=1 Tax=Xenorhabdus poinarii G6 TaxID=1354304 RepID=A0A068R7Y5_9GAMM|nr:protein of unknown function [Xenorhabdus poinarii G6]
MALAIKVSPVGLWHSKLFHSHYWTQQTRQPYANLNECTNYKQQFYPTARNHIS